MSCYVVLTPFVVFCADEQTRAEDTRAYVHCSLPGRIMWVAVPVRDGACSSHQGGITIASSTSSGSSTIPVAWDKLSLGAFMMNVLRWTSDIPMYYNSRM